MRLGTHAGQELDMAGSGKGRGRVGCDLQGHADPHDGDDRERKRRLELVQPLKREEHKRAQCLDRQKLLDT